MPNQRANSPRNRTAHPIPAAPASEQRYRFLVSFFLLLALIAFEWSPRLAAQVADSDLPSYDMEELKRTYEGAVLLFNSINQESSIQAFSDIISSIQMSKTADELTGEERRFVIESFQYRAQALFNLGEFDTAAQDFRRLLSVKPAYELDSTQVSPKIIQLFKEVRDELIGSLSVSAVPAGSSVLLDGKEVGISDQGPIYYFSGLHRLEVTRAGHDPHVQTIELAGGEHLEIGPLELVRSMATCKFLTVPSGVNVFIDGELLGVTRGSPSAEAREEARTAGYNPLSVSDVLFAPSISPGKHTLEFRKECYVDLTIELNFSEPTDYMDDVRALEPSRGTIAVRADPPASIIYLDGERVGSGDQVLRDICSGSHTIEARHEGGRFEATVELEKDGWIEMATALRPTLVFAGSFPLLHLADTGFVSADIHVVRERLDGLLNLNVVYPPQDEVIQLFRKHGLNPAQAPPSSISENLLQSMGKAFDCNLVLLSVEEGGNSQLRLYSTLHGIPEVVEYETSAGGLGMALERLVQRLSHSPVTSRPWIGTTVADVPLAQGFPVIHVCSDSPAAEAGLQVGDVISMVADIKLQGSITLRRAVSSAAPGDIIPLAVVRGTRTSTLPVKVGVSPVLLPPNMSDGFYNHMLETLRADLRKTTAGNGEAYVRLNMSICLMRLGLSEMAAGILQPIQLERSSGISMGTVYFYQALCAERVDRRDRAGRLYAQVLKCPESTLIDHDGPPARLAADGILKEYGESRKEAP